MGDTLLMCSKIEKVELNDQKNCEGVSLVILSS
jgi:hypothetical protein